MTTETMLQKVRAKLADRKGAELHTLTACTGIKYDTLLRIRDGKTDPPFSKVQALATYFRIVRS